MELVKTSELTGSALDWAVAVSIGWKFTGQSDQVKPRHRESKDYPGEIIDDWDSKGPHPRLEAPCGEVFYLCNCRENDDLPCFSSDWAQGGPLIESHCWALPYRANSRYHLGKFEACTPGGFPHNGPTPLIAACRAIVAAKLGETVEVPEELL